MHILLRVIATLSLAIPAIGGAQVPMLRTTDSPPISKRELHRLIKTAHCSSEYLRLASYFNERRAGYLAKAESERNERNRHFQTHAALYKKFPNPVDTAEALFDSYIYEADHAERRAQQYQKLAYVASQTNKGD